MEEIAGNIRILFEIREQSPVFADQLVVRVDGGLGFILIYRKKNHSICFVLSFPLHIVTELVVMTSTIRFGTINIDERTIAYLLNFIPMKAILGLLFEY